MPVHRSRGTQRARAHSFGGGFSLLEIVVVLILLGLLALFGTQMLTTVVRGYVLARSSDAVVQKAQLALQRMTIDFSYISSPVAVDVGTANRISYNANFSSTDVEHHVITQSGNTITYTVNGTPYVLTDSVATNGLQLTYFTAYNADSTSEYAAANIIGISLTMHDADWDPGVTKAFNTRVTIQKFVQNAEK